MARPRASTPRQPQVDALGFERSLAFALISTALTIAPAATITAPTAKATENPCTTAFGASRGP